MGLNTYKGALTYEAVAAALDCPYTPLSKLMQQCVAYEAVFIERQKFFYYCCFFEWLCDRTQDVAAANSCDANATV